MVQVCAVRPTGSNPTSSPRIRYRPECGRFVTATRPTSPLVQRTSERYGSRLPGALKSGLDAGLAQQVGSLAIPARGTVRKTVELVWSETLS